ncbi:MAG: hypothetical protein LQ351_002909 [Letrouitia transgressa]|nr:MAG: hypothetical protein LQ351_002909 [Letrouitia transgressa]
MSGKQDSNDRDFTTYYIQKSSKANHGLQEHVKHVWRGSETQKDNRNFQGGSTIVRTYSVVDVNVPKYPCDVAATILPAAKSRNFQVILGIWADAQASYESEWKALKGVLNAGNAASVYGITVGSESLYRGVSAFELLPRIKNATAEFGKFTKRIGTVDSWNKFQDGTADPIITGGVKFLLVNAFGYWQHQNINNATATYLDDLQQAIGHIQSLSGSLDAIEIWNGETGWPGDGGDDYGDAKAGTKNAATFYRTGVCAALDWGYNVFYFEAFDEAWKPKSTGDTGAQGDETHWGAFTADRKLKFSLSC